MNFRFFIVSLIFIVNVFFFLFLLYVPEIKNYFFSNYEDKQTNLFQSIDIKLDLSHYRKRVVYYKKRYWCSRKNKFRYYNQFIPENLNFENQNLKNYYKLIYLTPKLNNRDNIEFLYLESIYKNLKYPTGIWFYYDENQNFLKKVTYEKGYVKLKKIYTYKKKKSLIYKTGEYQYFYETKNSKNPILIQHKLYFYKLDFDNNKKWLSKENYYRYGGLTKTILYEYNHKNQLVQIKNFKLNNQLEEYSLYLYDQQGKKIKESFYNEENKKTSYKIFIYNNNDLLIKKEFWTFDLKHNKLNLFRIYEYTYNNFLLKKKEILHEKQYDYNNTFNKNIPKNRKDVLGKIYEIKYYYNMDGCIIKEKRFNSENTLIEELIY